MALQVGEVFAAFSGKDTGFSAMADSMKGKMESTASSITSVGTKLSSSVTEPIVNIGKAAVTAGSSFESSMSQVAATMGLTVDEVKNGSETFTILQDAAIEAGATTAFSASQASEALNYLALAGYDAEQAATALPKVLDLAAAGNMDLATTSDMVTDSMSSLGLEMSEMESFMDKMAKTSQKSNTSVEQLGSALLTVGGTAKNLAGGVTEANTCLGVLADNGIKGAEGGTALRNVILSLSAPTDKAAGALEELGIQVADAEGNMRPLPDIMKDLNGSLNGMGGIAKADYLNQIFNKVDLKSVNALMSASVMNIDGVKESLSKMGVDVKANADMINYLSATFQENEDKAEFCSYAMEEMGITAEQASVLYDGLNSAIKEGSNRFSELSAMIDNSKGACHDMAEVQLENLEGKIKLLTSVVETASIKIYQVIKPLLVEIVLFISSLVEKFNALSNEQIEQIVKWAALAAGIGPAVVAIGKVIQVGVKLKNSFMAIKGVMTAVSAAIGGISIPIVAAIAAITALVGSVVYLYKTNDEFRTSCQNCWNAIKEFLVVTFEAIKGIAEDVFNNLKEFWNEWGDTIKEIFSKVMDVLGTVFKAGLDLLTGLLQIFSAAFQGDWSAVWEATKQLFSVIWEDIKSFLASILELIKPILANFLQSVKTSWENHWNGVKEFFSSIWEGIKNTFNNAKQGVINIATNLCTGIKNALKSLPSSALDIAKNFVSGLINGIRNGISSVCNAVKDLAGKAVTAAKNALGIHSPSRVMMELGGYTGEGFKIGLEDTKDAISKVASNLVNTDDFGIQDIVRTVDFTPSIPQDNIPVQKDSESNVTIENTFNITTNEDTDTEELANRISRKIQQQIDRHNRGGGIVYA